MNYWYMLQRGQIFFKNYVEWKKDVHIISYHVLCKILGCANTFPDIKQMVGQRVWEGSRKEGLTVVFTGPQETWEYVYYLDHDNGFTSVYMSKLMCSLFHVSVSPLLETKKKGLFWSQTLGSDPSSLILNLFNLFMLQFSYL